MQNLRVMNLANRTSLWPSSRSTALAGHCAMLVAFVWATALAGASFGRQNANQSSEKLPDLKAFVGTWTATYKGDVFATLILKEERGGLSGTLNNFDINVDKDGNLIDGTHKDEGDAPLLDVHFKSGALYFTVLEKDQYRDGMNWKFVPLSARRGELTPLLEHQEDVPKDYVVKPIHVLREAPKP
jgi:hypothetical protein